MKEQSSTHAQSHRSSHSQNHSSAHSQTCDVCALTRCGFKPSRGVAICRIILSLARLCYTEKATEARHRLERQYNACANRKKQCRPNETKPYSNATHPSLLRGWSITKSPHSQPAITALQHVHPTPNPHGILCMLRNVLLLLVEKTPYNVKCMQTGAICE